MGISKESEKTLSRSQRRRRDDILQAAIEIFNRDGYEAARMIDIANEADVAKGTLYLYFDTKAALLEGVVEAVASPSIAVIQETAETHSGSAADLLKSQIETVAQRFASDEGRMLFRLLISEGPRFPHLTKFYYDNVISVGMRILKETLAYGVELGEFRPEVADLNPVVLAGTTVQTAIWEILFCDITPIDREKLLKDHIEISLQGLLV